MYNFFVKNSNVCDGIVYIDGEDFNHIKNVLRMRVGEEIYVSAEGRTHKCKITEFTSDKVIALIIEENALDTNLPIKITLFQGLPKADKLELIIQKAVELGADAIVPVEMKNCVVKIEDKKKKLKVERWQNISESASKQSKRNSVAKVHPISTFTNAIDTLKKFDLVIVPYENESGMKSTARALSLIKNGLSVAVVIGPEGGFDYSEIEKLNSIGALTISLGKRILRTETASITALSMLMLHAEMNCDKNI